jgi:hypothetical protein
MVDGLDVHETFGQDENGYKCSLGNIEVKGARRDE